MKKILLENTQEDIVLKYLKKTIQNTEWFNKIMLVGGAVRDEIMGLKPKDLDFVVNGDLNAGIDFSIWLAKKLGNFKQDSNPVIYPRFGTSKLTLKNNKYNLPDIELEFVAPRQEKYTEGSRKPEVSGGDLTDEVYRRDLTINSLLKNISTDEIIDLTGKGVDDIKNGIIRTTSDPDIIYGEDALRMMRTIRFSVKYGFEILPEVLNGIKKNAHLINTISSERISDELNKILLSKEPAKGLELLKDSGLLSHIIEEFNDAIGMTQNKHHKDDVFGHTINVLKNTPSDLKTRLMALFHDIGKTLTKSVSPDGSVHFYQHEEVGQEIAKKVMTRLKYPNDLINAVVSGIGHHMMLKQGGDDSTGISDKSLRKFAARVGDNLENILDLIHADNISHSDESSMPNQIINIRKRLQALNTQIDKNKIKLPINGQDLLKLGLKPSPIFKDILNAVEDAWFENPNITKDEAMKIVKKFIPLNEQINRINSIIKLL